LGWFGYTCYADPTTEKISMLAPITDNPRGSLAGINSLSADLLDAQFEIDYGSIHSDVVVASNETNKGAVCGKAVSTGAMSYYNPNNYNITKRYNPLFATTFKVADSGLLDVAKAILQTDVIGAQLLRVTVGRVVPVGLWCGFAWTDKNGQVGNWVVTGYNIEVSGNSAQTTMDCIIAPAVNIPPPIGGGSHPLMTR
jgi:hypothetical protein